MKTLIGSTARANKLLLAGFEQQRNRSWLWLLLLLKKRTFKKCGNQQ